MAVRKIDELEMKGYSNTLNAFRMHIRRDHFPIEYLEEWMKDTPDIISKEEFKRQKKLNLLGNKYMISLPLSYIHCFIGVIFEKDEKGKYYFPINQETKEISPVTPHKVTCVINRARNLYCQKTKSKPSQKEEEILIIEPEEIKNEVVTPVFYTECQLEEMARILVNAGWHVQRRKVIYEEVL